VIEMEIQNEAKRKLEVLCEKLGMPAESVVCHGNPAGEFNSLAQQQDIDLIVLGRHGQSGLQLLVQPRTACYMVSPVMY